MRLIRLAFMVQTFSSSPTTLWGEAANPERSSPNNGEPLWPAAALAASQQGLVEMAIELIESASIRGEAIDAPYAANFSLLEVLCDNSDPLKPEYGPIIRHLLKKGARSEISFKLLLHKTINYEFTAAEYEFTFSIMDILVENRPDLVNRQIILNRGDPYRFPLVIAILAKNPHLLRFLLQKPKINLNIFESHVGCIGLFIAFWQDMPDHIKLPILEIMLKAKAPVYDREILSSAVEPMEKAVMTYQASVVELLSQYGAAVNYHERYRTGPLLHAIWGEAEVEKKIVVMKILLERGAQINALLPPPTNTVIDDNFKKNLLPNLIPHATPLYFAIEGVKNFTARHSLVNFLLAHKADPNMPSMQGKLSFNFPLHLAISDRDHQTITSLMHAHADPYMYNGLKKYAFDIAEMVDKMFPTLRTQSLINSLHLANINTHMLNRPWVMPGCCIAFIGGIGLSALNYKNTRSEIIIIFCILPASIIGWQYENIKWFVTRNEILSVILSSVSLLIGITLLLKGQNNSRPTPSVPRKTKQSGESKKEQTTNTETKPTGLQQKKSAHQLPVQTPMSLISACQTGNIALVKKYIKEKADLNHVEKDLTPLQAACLYNHYGIVEILSEEKSVVIDKENSRGETAILLAAKQQHWPIVTLMLKSTSTEPVKIRHINKNHKNLLILAAKNLKYPIIHSILKLYSSVNKYAGTLLLQILLNSMKSSTNEGQVNEFIKSFVAAYPKAVNHQNTDKTTPLMVACQAGYAPAVNALLDAGANVHLLDTQGKSALYYAAAQAVKIASKNNAFINIIDKLTQKGSQLNTRWEIEDKLPLPNGETKQVEEFTGKLQLRWSHDITQKNTAWMKCLDYIHAHGKKLEEKELTEKRKKEKVAARQRYKQTFEEKKQVPAQPQTAHRSTPAIAPSLLDDSKQTVNHQSWADLIVDYIGRIGATQSQTFEAEQALSAEQYAFNLYMQHSLLVYYIHRLLFIITCYGRHIQSDYKLIDSGQIHNMMTKRGSKSLCTSLCYEHYDAVFALSDTITTQLSLKILQGLKKSHESRSALNDNQRKQVASLFGLIEEESLTSFRPVGQLFIKHTALYNVLEKFHDSLINNSPIKKEHDKMVKEFFLPAIRYIYHLLAEDKNAQWDTTEVVLKGQLNYEKLEQRYAHYLDLLILLFTLCGETLLKNFPFIKRCHYEVRNKIAHEAKISFPARFIMEMAKEGSQLTKRSIKWQNVMSMPDLKLVQTETEREIQVGLKRAERYNTLFESKPSSKIPAADRSCTAPPLTVITSYLFPFP